MSEPKVSALLLSCGSWYLPHTAEAFHRRDSLAGLWITFGNHRRLPPDKYRRAWPFQAAMLPFYKCAPEHVVERAFYAFFPLWKSWLDCQRFPQLNVVQAIMGYGTEPFNYAEKVGALKVIDCVNSHPVTFFGYWQRECDLWYHGHRVPIPRWMFARMTRELERADLILCPSLFVRDTMVQNGISEQKCFVLPFGVDSSVFTPRSSLPPTPRFVSVGAVCLRKGHQYLFRAFEIVKSKLPQAELICVGPYKKDFRNEKRKWHGTFTHWPGMRHSEIAALLKTCTAFVFPSQEEGFARVQTEAMACGLPIIGTYEAGTTTLVSDGIEGLIVRGRDPEHIAEAMLRLATDANLNRRMGNAAHEKIAGTGTWQSYGDQLLTKYREALASSPG